MQALTGQPHIYTAAGWPPAASAMRIVLINSWRLRELNQLVQGQSQQGVDCRPYLFNHYSKLPLTVATDHREKKHKE